MQERQEPGSLATLARLAATFARPLAALDQDGRSLGSLSPSEVESLTRHAAFRRPVELALLKASGLHRLALTPDRIGALEASPEGRLAVLLFTEPLPRLQAGALLLAAAALQKQVLQVTFKADRQRLREILGPEAHLVATQEAPTLHAGLAPLGDAAVLSAALAGERAPDAGRRTVVDFGLGLLQRFVAATAPALGSAMLKRLPAAARPGGAGDAQRAALNQIPKFIRRRVPAWSAIIG